VLSGKYNGVYDAQRLPKAREWKIDVLTRAEAFGSASEKPVVAYNEDGKIVCRYDSATKAMIAEGIFASNISACIVHNVNYAGKKDGHKLRWEYADPDLHALYECINPRKPKQSYYYIENGDKFYFKSITVAAENSHGKFALHTQRREIAKSIQSKGTIPCKAGHFWYKL
jgi:hypothetical protein